MKDMYTRLNEAGFDASFIRRAVLPDWWEDSLAEVPANRTIAEVAVARLLGFSVSSLRDGRRRLELPKANSFRLKCRKGATPRQVRSAVLIAERAAKAVAESVRDIPRFQPDGSAAELRKAILSTSPKVDLASLVNFCWEQGVVVLHISPDRMPKVKKPHGIAMFHSGTPFIVLCFGTDSPPWLAFHLAHELGHLFLKHVTATGMPLVDSSLGENTPGGQQESEADRFAIELLTGEKKTSLPVARRMDSRELASFAADYGQKRAIDPGTVVLMYGRAVGRWGVAQKALKRMKLADGACSVLAEALAAHIDVDDLPEASARFLGALSVVPS